MKYVYLGLNWVFGALLLLGGLVSFVEAPLAGLSLISISALLLPPVRNWVHSRTGKEITVKARAVSILVLFIAFAIFVGQYEQRKVEQAAEQEAKQRAEQAAAEQQKMIEYFNANSPQILADVEVALENREYQKAITLSSQYLVANNSELSRLNVVAKEKFAEVQRAEKTAKILEELKGVSSVEVERHKTLYQQLANLHPDNQEYQSKVKLYADKVAEEQEKKLAAEERKKKIETQFSAWDGSHRGLERVVKDSMNDPSSYDHVETVYWDRGDHLVVMTTFRGKNAFGGVVRNSVKAKVSLDGQVLQILDQN